MDDLRKEDGVEWIPARIEIDAKEESTNEGRLEHWPADWPPLNEGLQIRPKTLRFYLPGTALDEADKLLRASLSDRLTEIEGKTFFVSYRIPLPGEAAWIRARHE